MASVCDIRNQKYWTGCFTDANGKQRKRSTKQVDRNKALKVAEEWEQEYRKVRAEEQTRKVFAEIRREIHGETNLDQSIEDFFQEWLESKRNEIAPGTWKKYEQASRNFQGLAGRRQEEGH